MYLRGKSAFADQLFDHDPCWLQQWECDEADHSRRRYEPRAIHVPRPDAAGVRLRQVYAELGGMIGGSHKSELYVVSKDSGYRARSCTIPGGLKLS